MKVAAVSEFIQHAASPTRDLYLTCWKIPRLLPKWSSYFTYYTLVFLAQPFFIMFWRDHVQPSQHGDWMCSWIHECERFAVTGSGVTLSSVSRLRNAIDDSYFYTIASGLLGKRGAHGWAHNFTCSNATSLMVNGWCSNTIVRIIIILRIWPVSKAFARVLTIFLKRLPPPSMSVFVIVITSLFTPCIIIH